MKNLLTTAQDITIFLYLCLQVLPTDNRIVCLLTEHIEFLQLHTYLRVATHKAFLLTRANTVVVQLQLTNLLKLICSLPNNNLLITIIEPIMLNLPSPILQLQQLLN